MHSHSTYSLDISPLAATTRLGTTLGRLARAGDIILLAGNLGSGKTTLSQQIGAGLQVADSCYITSPTYALVHEYQGRLPLYHFDLYRLGEEDALLELGLDEMLYGDGVCLIEWPDRLGSLTPEEALSITLVFDYHHTRRADICPLGRQWRQRMDALRRILDG